MAGSSETLSRLAQSPDAQALASLLTGEHDNGELENLAQKAADGDIRSLQALMQSITEKPEGRALLQRLSDAFGRK